MSNPSTSKNIIFKTLVDDVAIPLYPKTSVKQIQIDDDHSLSDMLVTMCNTIDGNTKKITSVENKSPELPDNVKQLVINLFAGVANGNDKLTPVFEALCAEWGLTPTDDTPNTSFKILYNLENPTTFDPSKKNYIDTGIKLFDNITDEKFTIMIDFSNGDNASVSSTEIGTVMHCMTETSPYPGVAISILTDSGNAKLATYGSQQILTKTTSSTAFAGRNTKAVICFKGSQMRVVCPTAGAVATSESDSLVENKQDTGWFDVSGMTTTVAETLIFGACKETNGAMDKYFNGTINRCKVYSGICSDDMIQAFLNTTIVTLPTPKYKLSSPKTFVPANKEWIDTGIKPFAAINTNMNLTVYATFTVADSVANAVSVLCDCYSIPADGDKRGMMAATWGNGTVGVNMFTYASHFAKIESGKKMKFLLQIKGTQFRFLSYGALTEWKNIPNYVANKTVDRSLIVGASWTDATNTEIAEKTRFFGGTVYDFQVFDKALTDAQITALLKED